MAETSDVGYLKAELGALRRELSELHAEQREMAKALEELSATFRSLALHLGIAAEPYKKRGDSSRRDLPGFA
jgi:hypothetical protein